MCLPLAILLILDVDRLTRVRPLPLLSLLDGFFGQTESL